MKKIITLLLAVMLVFGVATTAFAAEIGDEETITFTVSDPGAAVFGAQINYDQNALELLSISTGELTGNGLFSGTAGTGKVAYLGPNNIIGSGSVFVATFKVKDSAEAGKTYDVTATVDASTTADADGKLVNFSISGGSITIDHVHAFSGEWTVEKAATCTENGSEYRTCTAVAGCTERETRVINALGHDLKTVTKEATCTEKGTVTTTCTRCDYEKIEYTDAKGHAMGDWTVTKEATCTEKGTETSKCANCTHAETRDIAAKGHAMGDWTVTKEATCTEKGTETSKCANCTHTETIEIAAKGHSFGDWTIDQDATCTQEGSRSRVCANCGATETDTIAVLGHDFKHVHYDDVDHWYSCDCCATTSPEAHNFENSGVCSVCGYQKHVTEDPKLDNIPKTGDITYRIVSVPLTILAVTACAILVMILAEKRRNTK